MTGRRRLGKKPRGHGVSGVRDASWKAHAGGEASRASAASAGLTEPFSKHRKKRIKTLRARRGGCKTISKAKAQAEEGARSYFWASRVASHGCSASTALTTTLQTEIDTATRPPPSPQQPACPNSHPVVLNTACPLNSGGPAARAATYCNAVCFYQCRLRRNVVEGVCPTQRLNFLLSPSPPPLYSCQRGLHARLSDG